LRIIENKDFLGGIIKEVPDGEINPAEKQKGKPPPVIIR
jgi:hypothetical protein